MRFSASSQTTDCGPSMHLVGHFLAAVRGQAVEEQRIGPAWAISAALTW
jgi:hypothetical protein